MWWCNRPSRVTCECADVSDLLYLHYAPAHSHSFAFYPAGPQKERGQLRCWRPADRPCECGTGGGNCLHKAAQSDRSRMANSIVRRRKIRRYERRGNSLTALRAVRWAAKTTGRVNLDSISGETIILHGARKMVRAPTLSEAPRVEDT